MTTFICGRYDDDFIRKLTKEFWEEIDSIKADGDEVLLFDDMDDNQLPEYFKDYEKTVNLDDGKEMLKKCNKMMAVWSSEEQVFFAYIMAAIVLKKPCRLFVPVLRRWFDINSLNDMELFVNYSRRNWEPEIFEPVLRKCGFKDEMVAHLLKREDLTEEIISSIICNAPVSIEDKLEMFIYLKNKSNYCYGLMKKTEALIELGYSFDKTFGLLSEYTLTPLIDKMIDLILDAKSHLNHKVFCVFDEKYDESILFSFHDGVFDSFNQVMDYINKLDADREDEDCSWSSNGYWYKVEEWDLHSPDLDGHIYEYFICNGKICWFRQKQVTNPNDCNRDIGESDSSFADEYLDHHLKITIPFKEGDLVNIDCSPFGPPLHALIIDSDIGDEGRVGILYKRPNTQIWRFSFIAQWGLYYGQRSLLSPLYRLRSVREDEHTVDDAYLIEIGKSLKNNADLGKAFWKARFKYIGYLDKSIGDVMETWRHVLWKNEHTDIDI